MKWIFRILVLPLVIVVGMLGLASGVLLGIMGETKRAIEYWADKIV